MGTRGYRVFRFRGRYYRFYNSSDSFPEGLGAEIVSEIPIHPEAYQRWLAERREEALKWHVHLQRVLCRNRAHYEGNRDLDERASESDDSQVNEFPWDVATDSFPDFEPAFNDLWISWIYTIDLDNEVFTVNNGIHVHLNRIPHLDWINAIEDGVLLPSSVPEEAIADIIVKLPSTTASMLEMHNNLEVRIVKPKGLNAIPLSKRHGPLLRASIFCFFQQNYHQVLSATLLSWRPEELPFREIAYAILCLASVSFNISLVPCPQKGRSGYGYTELKKTNEEGEKAELLADLGVGCHLEGLPPGSSPDSKMYWFDGALVYLAVQLFDLPDAVSGAVACVVEYCQSQRPNQCVNAVLMSIEHIVLMRVYPGGRVQRTALLPLFVLPIHTSTDARERYEADYPERLQMRKEKAIQSEQLNLDDEEEEEDDDIDEQKFRSEPGSKSRGTEDTKSSFIALTNFLEASSRQQMPPSRHREGIFPTEIYGIILLSVEDLQTHHACMQVSRSFRDLCQRHVMMMDGITLHAVDPSQTYNPAGVSFPALCMKTLGASFPALRMKTLSAGWSQVVKLTRMSANWRPRNHEDSRWRVVVGSQRNRRSKLPKLLVGLDPIG